MYMLSHVHSLQVRHVVAAWFDLAREFLDLSDDLVDDALAPVVPVPDVVELRLALGSAVVRRAAVVVIVVATSVSRVACVANQGLV